MKKTFNKAIHLVVMNGVDLRDTAGFQTHRQNHLEFEQC
jgi:hypothetical protein